MVVVAAVDRTDRGLEVVREGEKLAKAFAEPLHVIHVLTRSEFVELEQTEVNQTGSTLDISEVRNFANNIAADAAHDIEYPIESVGIVGDPANEVVEYADNNNARYIVVGGRKRSPIGKVVFGSVAQSIIMNADTPVVMSVENE